MELLSWSFKIFVTFNFLEILPLFGLLAAPPAVHHPTELLVIQLIVPWYVKLGKSSCDLGWGQVVAKLFKFLNREKDIYENSTLFLFIYWFSDFAIMIFIHEFESSFILCLFSSELSPRQLAISIFIMWAEQLVNILPGKW